MRILGLSQMAKTIRRKRRDLQTRVIAKQREREREKAVSTLFSTDYPSRPFFPFFFLFFFSVTFRRWLWRARYNCNEITSKTIVIIDVRAEKLHAITNEHHRGRLLWYPIIMPFLTFPFVMLIQFVFMSPFTRMLDVGYYTLHAYVDGRSTRH